MSDQKSMGDLFMQRRAAAAAAGRNSGAPTTGFTQLGQQPNQNQGGSSSGRAKSFAEIQREQQMESSRQREQQMESSRQREQQGPGGGSRGGGFGSQHGSSQHGGRSGGGGDRHQADEYGRLARPSQSGARDGGGYTPSGRGPGARGDGRRDNRGGRSQRTADRRASLPIEQGVIHTLLDKFGFIMCADRDKELFFHYSEYKEGHSDDLNIGDEVEFRVGKAEERRGRGGSSSGGGDGDKMSAFDVRKLPEGTIYWEKEDEPGKRFKGKVEQAAREERRGAGGMGRDRDRGRGGGSSAANEGVIRFVADEGEELDDERKALEVRYAASDYKQPRPGHSRLDRKDVVEFALVTKRRTGKKYARDISLIQSERERAREEREAKQLEDAKLEQGIVVTDKGDFGFLRSALREEEVYFHISHILPSEDDGDGKGRVAMREGQEVEFYAIEEAAAGGGKRGKKISARKIKLLPKGTVKFEQVIAQGVTGLVVECPIGSFNDPFSSSRDSRKASGANQPAGKIRLQQPITDGDGNEVKEVILRSELYPGGTFAISRTGSEVGCWIRPNDTLLFDVVQKIVNGKCYALPTKYVHSPENRPDGWDVKDSKAKPSIRLVEPTLCGRAEGVVKSVHDNYGFVHLAERGVDAYFPLFEVFPGEMQGDLARNNPDIYTEDNMEGIPTKGGRVNVDVGTEVAIDLSLQMAPSAGPSRGREGGRYGGRPNGRQPQEKESLRARRLQILPKGTVKERIPLVSGVKAAVSKVDSNQLFLGTLELEESIKVETSAERHPLAARLADVVSKGKYGDEVTFHDAMSDKDAQAVISMVNARDDLEWRYVPEDATDDHARRLCITRKKESDGDVLEGGSEADIAEPSGAEASIASEKANDAGEEAETAKETPASGKPATTTGAAKHDSHKKRPKKAKVIKTIRFDKFSFPDMSVGPPGVGDVVTCDIVQVRRTGVFAVENVVFVERKERPVAVSDTDKDGKENTNLPKSLQGFVTEVVPSRQFGFITAVDEQGSKTGEHVFFHFKEIQQTAGEDVAQDGGTSSLASRSRKPGARGSADAIVRKGDEVKFEAGPGKNGKLNATGITILPRGTLKVAVKADKSTSCTGYILMEPSHTSLANTPSHITFQSGPASGGGAGGRWANVKDDKSFGNKPGSKVKEEGVILLLSDPSHLFSTSVRKVDSPTKKDAAVPSGERPPKEDAKTEGVATESNGGADAKNGEGKVESKDVEVQAQQSAVGMHLRYKLSSTAHRSDPPRRGDLVTFGKPRSVNLVKDIRVEKMAAANSVRGILVDIDKDGDAAVFVSSEDEARYDVKLTEVVSCDKSLLKEKEQVDGILHEGKIFGVCRTKDIYLASSIGRNSSGSSGGLKERPKLNLTVKKELQGMGGQIMAQSRMARGPDGTNGFAEGWTRRASPHAEKEKEEKEAEEAAAAAEEDEEEPQRSTSLSAAASEFVPTFSVSSSGFD